MSYSASDKAQAAVFLVLVIVSFIIAVISVTCWVFAEPVGIFLASLTSSSAGDLQSSALALSRNIKIASGFLSFFFGASYFISLAFSFSSNVYEKLFEGFVDHSEEEVEDFSKLERNVIQILKEREDALRAKELDVERRRRLLSTSKYNSQLDSFDKTINRVKKIKG